MRQVTFSSAQKKICLKQARERSGLAEIRDFLAYLLYSNLFFRLDWFSDLGLLFLPFFFLLIMHTSHLSYMQLS